MQNKPVEERNVLVAVALSMAVLFFWSIFFAPAIPTKKAPQSQPNSAMATPEATSAAHSERSASLPAESSALPLDRQQEKKITIDSPLYRAELTNRGAGLSSYQLKGYPQASGFSKLVEMVPQASGIQDYFGGPYTGSDRQEVIAALPTELENLWLPLSVRLTENPDGFLLGKAIYQVDAPSNHLELKDNASASVTFQLQTPFGLALKKTLTFHADTYLVDCDLELRNTGTTVFSGSPQLVVTEGYRQSGIHESTRYDQSSPVFSADSKRTLPTLPERGKQTWNHEQVGPLDWAGIDDLYFLSAIVPVKGVGKMLIEKTDTLQFWRVLIQTDAIHLQPGQSETINSKAYYGPKENKRLVALGYHLDRAIDYGMFRFLALPMVSVLKWFQYITGSYGLAIIALTVLVKALTYPLTAAQIQSMEKMKALAPEMEKLKAKYGKDSKEPERFNQEMLNLYKRHQVNPASGCWPILVQMPIFLSLYSGLLYSIDLRLTPFLYIPDLSQPDPFLISPLLMGVSMFLQTRMSPPPADPAQASVMKFMPVIFTGLFLFAPAGLVTYWLVNNVLSIAQQYWMRQKNQQKA